MSEVSYGLPTGLPDPAVLAHAGNGLLAIPDAQARQDAVATLFKLVDGVLAAPEDPKRRRVKKGNEVIHRKIGRHPCAVDFLRGVGFAEADDPDAEGEAGKGALLVMPIAFITRLTDAHHTLARIAGEAGLPAPALPSGVFNPYQSSAPMATHPTMSSKATSQWQADAEKVREEVKKRQRELEEVNKIPPVPMRPMAFWLTAGARLEEIIRQTESDHASQMDAVRNERAADNELMKQQMASAKACINGGNEKFESADKRRLAELQKKKVHTTCVLRVVCPDKSVLQAAFRAADTGQYVMEQLDAIWAQSVRDAGWYLYQTPPMRRLQPTETLAKAGLAPGAQLYIGFEGAKPPAPFMQPDFLRQLGSPPESQHGVFGSSAPGAFSGEAMGWGRGAALGAAEARAAAASGGAAPAPKSVAEVMRKAPVAAPAEAPAAALAEAAADAPAADAAPAPPVESAPPARDWGAGQTLGSAP